MSAMEVEAVEPHPGNEDDTYFSHEDLNRFALFGLGNPPDPHHPALKAGIDVSLFKAGMEVPICRLSTRVVDQHLYHVKQHPVQLSMSELQEIWQTKDHKHVNEHVAKVCHHLLQCHSVGPKHPKQQGTLTALQYITCSTLTASTKDYSFHHHSHQNFLNFIKATFFSKAYIKRVIVYQQRSSPRVSSGLHACMHVCSNAPY
jgi:hypothetical protein